MNKHQTGPAALRAGEARFRSLIELVADFYWETDSEHRFTVIEASGVTQPEFSAASRLGRTRWEVPSVAPLGMPYLDGRRVAMAVKEASPATPVILLTGWGQRMVAEGGIPPHVDRVLAKPPRLRELREALALLYRQPHPPETIT